MATPTGPGARAARGWFARERRRTKRNLSEFLRQGITPQAPFDFGAVAAGGNSANTLTLPANTRFVLELDAAVGVQGYGVFDQTTDFENVEAVGANGRGPIRHLFRRDQDVQISRDAGTPAGALNVYFDDQAGKLTLIGTATFT